MKMPWKGREVHVFFVLLPNTTFLPTRWNSKRIKEILTQRQKVISHPDPMIREYVLIWTLILIGPVTLNLMIHSISLSKNALLFAFYRRNSPTPSYSR